MATITKGKTFTNGELVTPANLHQMVDSATVANIVNADIAANAAIADTKLATISTANKVSQSAVTNLTTDLAGKAASIHQHAISDTTGLQTALDGKAAASHTHTIANVTGLQTALDGKQASGSYAPATGIAPSAITGTAVITTDSRLSDARTPTSHTHDDRYYTESEIDIKLSGLPVSGHTHSATDITSGTLANARTTATSANTASAIVARDASGNFSAGIITANLTGTASGNAPASGIAPSAITGTAVITTDSRLSDARTPVAHTHDDRYYTETEINTLLAGKQAAGSYAPATGISPNAITGTAIITTDSRLLPPGAIMPFAMNSAPSGWLAANGNTVSRTTYAALFAAIGTIYGAGDGSTTFHLPDLRGYFVRGAGTNSDGSVSGAFGEKQTDAFGSHRHGFSDYFETAVRNFNFRRDGSQGGCDSTSGSSASSNTDYQGSTETRPKNVAMLYCIKF